MSVKYSRLGPVGEIIHPCRILVGTAKGKRRSERPEHGWEYTIKMNHEEIGC
jgi:hypothetical protein